MLSDDFDVYANKLKKSMKICFKCRDHFHVWPHRQDERFALNTKDPAIRAQWTTGGDTNFNRRTIPSGLNMKKHAAELTDPSREEHPFDPEEHPFDPEMHPFDPDEVEPEVQEEQEEPFVQEPAPPRSFSPQAPSPPPPETPSSSSTRSEMSYSIHEGLEDSLEDMLAPDEYQPSDDDDQGDHDDSVPETESICELVEIDNSFFRGKTLILPVMSGEDEPVYCCLCHQPVDEGEALTTHLEFKLRLNAILSDNRDSFGIVFDYQRGDAPYQMVCNTCLTSGKDSEHGQTVRDSVFTIEFHKRTGVLNPAYPTNVVELFNTKSNKVNDEMVNYLRDRFSEQERMLRLVFMH